MTASESQTIAAAFLASPTPRPVRSLRNLVIVVLSVALSGVMLIGQPSVAQARALSVQDRGTAQLADQALAALDIWRSDESPSHYVAYLEGRDLVARSIASQLNVDPIAIKDAWRDLPLTRQIVTLTAVAQAGIRYRSLGKHPGEGFDCSGLTGFAWNAVGVTIGSNSRGQYRAGTKITKDQAQAGDLIWYPGHIMMYLGAADLMIHAPYSGRNVEIRQMTPSRIRNSKFASPVN